MFFTVFFNFGEFAENFVGEKPKTRQMASMRPTVCLCVCPRSDLGVA